MSQRYTTKERVVPERIQVAHSIPCRYCGHYEGAHDARDHMGKEELKTTVEGYKKTLDDCRGYVPKNRKVHDAAEARARDLRQQEEMARARRMGGAG